MQERWVSPVTNGHSQHASDQVIAGMRGKSYWRVNAKLEHFILPVHAAGGEADDFGGSSALNPTNLSSTLH
jgi:hypothetical protein